MIIFLFGTWGSGKSYVGELIQARCGLLHVEADIHFDKKMLGAIHARSFHELDLTPYYERVITDIFSYQKRATHFVVSQGIYAEHHRKMIYDVFQPDIRFVWVKMEHEEILKARLDDRSARSGNPITYEVYEYMRSYWEEPRLPHFVLMNEGDVWSRVEKILTTWGICYQWGEQL